MDHESNKSDFYKWRNLIKDPNSIFQKNNSQKFLKGAPTISQPITGVCLNLLHRCNITAPIKVQFFYLF